MWLVVIYRGKKKPRHKLFLDRRVAEQYVKKEFGAISTGQDSFKGVESEYGMKFNIEVELEFLVADKRTEL